MDVHKKAEFCRFCSHKCTMGDATFCADIFDSDVTDEGLARETGYSVITMITIL